MTNERSGPETVQFEVTASIDPTNKPLTVEAWVKPEGPGGVIVAHGGPAQGYALFLQNRKPTFAIRSGGELTEIQTPDRLKNGWHHLAGVLTREKEMQLYVDGVLAASGKPPALISSEPKQKLELGGDTGAVGSYKDGFPFVGSIDEVRITHRALTAAEIATSFEDPEQARAMKADVVVHCTFDDGNAKDSSGKHNDGNLGKLPTGQGRIGTAVVFPKAAGAAIAVAAKQMGFDYNWTKFVPTFPRAMVLGKDALIISGPPDLVDEEYALERLAAKDEAIREQLQAQADALDGKKGGRFNIVSTKDGSSLADMDIDTLPVWDGISTAYGRIYMATTDGRVICLGYGE